MTAEVEDHACEWHYDDRDYPGSLVLAADRPPTGQLFGAVIPRTSPMAFPQYIETPALRGRLRNHEEVVLLDAELQVWWEDRAFVSAAAAVVGLNLWSHEPAFPELEMQVEGLPAVIGTIPFARYEWPASEKLNPLDGVYRATGNPSAHLEWPIDGGGKLKCDYDVTMRQDDFQQTIRTSPIIRVAPEQPHDLFEFVEHWATPLRQLVTFQLGERRQITWLNLRGHPREPRREGAPTLRSQFRVYGTEIGQESYSAERLSHDQSRVLFRFTELDAGLPATLRRWHELVAAESHAMKPYLNTLFIADLPIRARFLYLAQALEGLHRSGDPPEGDVAFTAERERILKLVKELGLPKADRAFLHDRLPRYGGPTFRARLQELIDDAPDVVRARDSVAELPQRLSSIRDNLSHGLQEHDPDELKPLTRTMKLLADAHILQRLGLDGSWAVRLDDDR